MTLIEILGLLMAAALVALVLFAWSRTSLEAYHEAYDKAQTEDLRFAREHPGCTYEQAHRNRDAVDRRFHR